MNKSTVFYYTYNELYDIKIVKTYSYKNKYYEAEHLTNDLILSYLTVFSLQAFTF